MKQAHPVVGGQVLGPGAQTLTLTRILGAGAFGIVFEATSSDPSARFAVKFLQTGVLATEHERRALMNEVMAAKEVRHENVVSVLHVSADDHDLSPYLVTEFADGGTLQARLEDCRRTGSQLPLDLVHEWSLAICDAMKAVNARLLHRDVKPDNILLSNDKIRVADFGLAKLIGEATRSVTFKGGQHLLYMAPEAWEGRSNDIQIDMYSAGLVLYELSTLQYPYAIPSPTMGIDALRQMHLFGDVKNPRTLRPELPLRYAEVVVRLLSKRPEARYPSWDDVIRALERGNAESANATGDAVLTERLARIAHSRQEKQNEAVRAEEAKRQKRLEWAKVDKSQEREIVDRFRDVVTEFNNRAEGLTASLSDSGPDGYMIQFPHAAPARLIFFSVVPPLSLPPFGVRYAAQLSDAKGCGCNLLLRRREGEQFGQWVVCRIRVNPISSYAHPTCKYFGLDSGSMQEIETGLRAMHVYIPEISEDVDAGIGAFVESIFEAATQQ